MKAFDQCPVCGGERVVGRVQKLIRVGPHTAPIVDAEVCYH